MQESQLRYTKSTMPSIARLERMLFVTLAKITWSIPMFLLGVGCLRNWMNAIKWRFVSRHYNAIALKKRKLNVLVRLFFFIQIKCEIIFHYFFSLFIHTFSKYAATVVCSIMSIKFSSVHMIYTCMNSQTGLHVILNYKWIFYKFNKKSRAECLRLLDRKKKRKRPLSNCVC